MSRFVIILLLLFFFICFVTTDVENLLKSFKEYTVKYNKTYQNDSGLLSKRFNIFKENLHRYENLNKKHANETLVYGINKFSDLTPEEFKKIYLSDLIRYDVYKHKNNKTPLQLIRNLKIPQTVDWRKQKIISSIKNQGHCGACWAFSTTETVESMFAKAASKPVPDLSVQEVIDCAKGNYGCSGGDTCTALKWMMNNKTKLVHDEDYPLVDQTQKCHRLSPALSGVSVSGFTCMDYVGNEQKMLQLLSEVGPLVTTVDASTWNSYMGGIIKFHCSNYNNHAVQIVGYDLTGDVPYYIIRNSWGTDFGDNGYIYVEIGDNLCGIAERVSTVNVVS